ncbi:MAG: lipoyl(octanoyl) transferase LipB [Hyphomonadaceae bacterium]
MTTGWTISEGLVSYPEAVAAMESRVAAIAAGEADELIWLLEHPPLYTKGASAQDSDLLDPTRFPVFESQRGGQFTYHGPGQRVAYVMLDLTKRGRDVKRFVCSLEDWIIQTLGTFNVKGERRKGRVGVWVDRSKSGGQLREDKIAAIGVRLKRWVSYHGISLNVEPDLTHFGGITPCGVTDPGLGVTSLADLGQIISMHEVDMALKAAFEKVFGPAERVAPPL